MPLDLVPETHRNGVNLGALVAERRRLALDEAAEVVLQVAEGVAEARALGVVLRDLGPSKLVLTRRRDGTPVVNVLAYRNSKEAPALASSSRERDVPSDIRALGAIFYELLTGETPFNGWSLPHGVAALEGVAPPIRSRLPELPIEIAATIGRSMMRDPMARQPSVADLAAEIAPFAPKRARAAVERIAAFIGSAAPELPSSPIASGVSSPIVTTRAAWVETVPPSSSHRLPFAALFVVALALLGILGSVVGVR